MTGSFASPGALIIGGTEGGIGQTSGTWSIDLATISLYSSLIIAFQGETAQTNPDQAWFNLITLPVSGLINGTWSILSSNGKELERAYLYGVAAVPVQAGIALGATGLGLLGLMGWRRKKAVVA